MSKKIKFVWTVPNVLTLIRLLLIPVFVRYMLKNQMMCALIVFLIASFTDAIDGYIARKHNAITDFGKLADPIADKLMVLCLMCGMVIKGIAPLSAIIIILVKEFLMILGGMILFNKNRIVYSMPIGKVAQFITVLALIACFFHEYFTKIHFPLHMILLWTGVALSVSALFYYAYVNRKGFIKNNNHN